MATLIVADPTIAADPYSPEAEARLFGLSDGSLIALWIEGTDTLYAIRTAAGSWGSPATIASGIDYLGPAGATAQAGDTITLWLADTGAGGVIVKPLVWNPATHTLTAGTSTTIAIPGPTAFYAVDALYEPSSGKWKMAVVYDSGGRAIATYDVTAGSYSATAAGTVFPLSTTTEVEVVRSGSAVYVGWVDGGTTVGIQPFSSLVAPETAYTGVSVSGLQMATDSSGNIDLVFRSSTSIVTVKRTGTNTFSGGTTLHSNAAGPPSVAVDAASGTAMVFVKSTLSQTNGEIRAMKRTAGSWDAGTVVDGGDAAGYASPSAAPNTIAGSFQWIFVKGNTALNYAIWHDAAAQSSAPDTPIVTAPNGNTGSLTPTLTAAYSNTGAPADPMHAYQWIVTRVSDSVVMFDSTKTVSTATSVTYAGSTLAYGIAYTAKVRYWDTLLDSPSAYSTPVTFTPQVAATAVINSVTVNGATDTSSPVTLTGSAFTLTATATHPSGHAQDAFQVAVLDSAGTSTVYTSSITALAITSGTPFTTTLINASGALVNLTTYKLAIRTRDAVSGVWSDYSALWTANVVFAPPDPPTVTRVVQDDAAGTLTFEWTNDVDASGSFIERSEDGITWEIVPVMDTSSGIAADVAAGSATTRVLFPDIGMQYTYRISATGNTGTSDPAEVATITMNGYSRINDVSDPIAYSLALPMLAPADDPLDGLMWQEGADSGDTVYVPQGGTRPIALRGIADYETTSRQFFFWALDTDAPNAREGTDLYREIRRRKTRLFYRDAFGTGRFCIFTPGSGGAGVSSFSGSVTFGLTEVDGPVALSI